MHLRVGADPEVGADTRPHRSSVAELELSVRVGDRGGYDCEGVGSDEVECEAGYG